MGDCIAPGLAVAQGLGRIGCYLAGCCWGAPTRSVFGVTFTSELAHKLTGVPLNVSIHPTQLYEAVAVFGIIPFLMWFRTTRRFYGAVFLFYIGYYAIVRFFIEFVRDDPRGYYFNLLSTSQLIALLILPFSILVWLRLKSRPHAVSAETF
jgi:phosphatidylglycerol:prolipoprotein diacylglycerol transferase